MTPYTFKDVDSLKFSINSFSAKGGEIFCVTVSDEQGQRITDCIGSSVSPDRAKAVAIENLAKAIHKIAVAEVEAK